MSRKRDIHGGDSRAGSRLRRGAAAGLGRELFTSGQCELEARHRHFREVELDARRAVGLNHRSLKGRDDSVDAAPFYQRREVFAVDEDGRFLAVDLEVCERDGSRQ